MVLYRGREMTKSDFFSGLFLSSRVLTEGYVRECFYQPAAREARGELVLRLLCVFRVCWYICASACTQ